MNPSLSENPATRFKTTRLLLHLNLKLTTAIG